MVKGHPPDKSLVEFRRRCLSELLHLLGKQQPLNAEELEKLVVVRANYQGAKSVTALPVGLSLALTGPLLAQGKIVEALGYTKPVGGGAYTFVMLGWFLFCTGLLYGAILDTRYRCRTCLRRLRMPIKTGSWSHVLLGPSKTEYICPYGHGTLKVFEIQSSGPHPPDWQAHDDIWKELFSPEESKK